MFILKQYFIHIVSELLSILSYFFKLIHINLSILVFLKSVFFSNLIFGHTFFPWQILVEIFPFHSSTEM